MLSTSHLDDKVRTLRLRIRETESQLRELKLQLEQAEANAFDAHQHQLGQNLEPEWQAEVMAALGQGHGEGGDHRMEFGQGEAHEAEDMDVDDLSQDPRKADQPTTTTRPSWLHQDFPLRSEEYKRFGRQLIMPEIGLTGQLRLRESKVLIVGAGGLGCPAAAYLAGAGVGTLGLVDGDVVEVSNLHRQIAHDTARVGMLKVDSAIEYLSGINPNTIYMPHRAHLTPTDALDIFSAYDIVLDCTDHPTSRYLISDAAVLAGKPLVSASALRTEGQLVILNNPPCEPGSDEGGPCYRCIFPKPPPADAVMSCGEGGILGPVVGVMGVLQALETIKMIAAGIDFRQDSEESEDENEHDDMFSPSSFASSNSSPSTPKTPRPQQQQKHQPTMLLFSAYSSPPFRTVRLRSRRKDCASCSSASTITPASLTTGSLDYTSFCGVRSTPPEILSESNRLSASELASLFSSSSSSSSLSDEPTARSPRKLIILDVRPETEFSLAHLPNAINIPWPSGEFKRKMESHSQALKKLLFEHSSSSATTTAASAPDVMNGLLNTGGPRQSPNETDESKSRNEIIVVCAKGNDSQLAASLLLDICSASSSSFSSSSSSSPSSASSPFSDPTQQQQKVPSTRDRSSAQEQEKEEASAKGGNSAPASASLRIRDLKGGLRAWRRAVDPEWPEY